MPLPKITALNTVTITPTTATEFPDSYMVELRVLSQPAGAASARITLKAYNYDTGELAPGVGTETQVTIADLNAEVVRSPVVAQVFGGVVYAVSLLVAEKKILSALKDAQALVDTHQSAIAQAEGQKVAMESALAQVQAHLAEAEDLLAAAQAMDEGEDKTAALAEAEGQLSALTAHVADLSDQIAALVAVMPGLQGDADAAVASRVLVQEELAQVRTALDIAA